jgi:hypothetical protein
VLSPYVLGLALAASMAAAGPDDAASSPQAATAIARQQEQPPTENPSRKKAASSRHAPAYRHGAFEATLDALVQEDTQRSTMSGSLSDYQLRRNRVGVSGHMFEHVEFDVEREITTEHKPVSSSRRCPRGTTARGKWRTPAVRWRTPTHCDCTRASEESGDPHPG